MINDDISEAQEWRASLRSLHKKDPKRAKYILSELVTLAQKLEMHFPCPPLYLDTAVPQMPYPGDLDTENRINAYIRWNAIAMVMKAGLFAPELGGHLATYASASWLYEIGFHHFFKAKSDHHGGDLLYIQGHASPGIYARAFLEGRLSKEQLSRFRQEVDGQGLSSYPHPWLMPDFWQFPTVSMGLGPLQAIYQARFLKYLHNRSLAQTEGRKVWAFLGDGEVDEPESLGALSIASRESLDNLIFVINCNLQRLDGPVRGNGKIIQELAGIFHGAGWRVIQVLWGSAWDALFQKDHHGILHHYLQSTPDGAFQHYGANDGAYMRLHFFGQHPELASMVADWSDDDLNHLARSRGGHDPLAIYNAYHAAVHTKDQPVVVLAQTIKGYGMGIGSGEGMNTTHQQKKMNTEALKKFCERFQIPLNEQTIEQLDFITLTPEDQCYLLNQRQVLGGFLPSRSPSMQPLVLSSPNPFQALCESSDQRELSTTMAFVRCLNILLKDPVWGPRIVPIVPDECRTFGMEGLFRQIGIYSPKGQTYRPVDADHLLRYHEDVKGQILEEGINEAGAFASWMAAGNAYASSHLTMVPFYIYYSMFGFQRTGDLAWAAADMGVRGFLMGATSGRTTLAGEGLQHQDGHQLVMANLIPNVISYDPCFSYELAVILQHGLKDMYELQRNVFYYITLLNENYTHPPMPEGVQEGIIKGIYPLPSLSSNTSDAIAHIHLMGSGAILREVIAAADDLWQHYHISSDLWSVTSFNELARDGMQWDRTSMMCDASLSVGAPRSYVYQCLDKKKKAPIVAATDYVRAYAEQIRPYLPYAYHVLGTDGFGRSDTRSKLRQFFEVDRASIVLAALWSLANEGLIPVSLWHTARSQHAHANQHTAPWMQ